MIIQKLAEEAKKNVPPGLLVEQWISVYNQTFANLIIENCIQNIALDTANYPGVGAMSYYQGVQDAVKSIRKHFEVKSD